MLATQRVFEAAIAADVRVDSASSSSDYGNADAHPTPEETVGRPVSPYGVTKLTCEHLAGAYAETRGLDAVIQRCLAQDRHDRYQHASEVHAALEAVDAASIDRPCTIPPPSSSLPFSMAR